MKPARYLLVTSNTPAMYLCLHLHVPSSRVDICNVAGQQARTAPGVLNTMKCNLADSILGQQEEESPAGAHCVSPRVCSLVQLLSDVPSDIILLPEAP